jgi:hypothetical protein
MSVAEIARCLFKPRWADASEYSQALNAFARLTPDMQEQVNKLKSKYA